MFTAMESVEPASKTEANDSYIRVGVRPFFWPLALSQKGPQCRITFA